ncbi:MAG: (d)CMP kinase [Nitrospiria bacterium]
MVRKMTIAIDGPSASGKTTAARLLARDLGYSYLDTGLLYRAVAWKVVKEKTDPANESAVSLLCECRPVTVEKKDPLFRIRVDGVDVTDELKTPQLSNVSSMVSKYRAVRESLMTLQREIGEKEGIILVGRDIGTEILPDAPVKFFMDASVEVRGRRRYEELIKKGFQVELDQTIQEMTRRDRRDSERKLAPLLRAKDAILIDTSGLTLNQVVEKMRVEVERIKDKETRRPKTFTH